MLKFFVKTEIGQRSRLYKMQDMCANSNQGMVFELVVSLKQGGKNESLESSPRLGLICFKTFRLNLKKKIHFNFNPITCIYCIFDT